MHRPWEPSAMSVAHPWRSLNVPHGPVVPMWSTWQENETIQNNTKHTFKNTHPQRISVQNLSERFSCGYGCRKWPGPQDSFYVSFRWRFGTRCIFPWMLSHEIAAPATMLTWWPDGLGCYAHPHLTRPLLRPSHGLPDSHPGLPRTYVFYHLICHTCPSQASFRVITET